MRASPEAYQNNPRVGLIAGSGGGSPRFQVFGADAMRGPRGLKAVGPYVVTKAMASGVSACLATPFKIHGVNYSISSACATSAHCIGNAVEQIQLGKQDIVFAGGGEELCWEMACEFDAMGALSTKYNDTPEKPPVLTMLTVTVSLSLAAAVWWWLKSWNTRWRVVLTSMLKSLATAQRLMAQTWLLPLAKAQYVVCRWRCMALIPQSIT